MTVSLQEQGSLHVIVIAARKGGQGKSCLARNLAVCALQDGFRAAIIDADDQGTLVNWKHRRENESPAVLPVGASSISESLKTLANRKADVVFVDLPPFSLPLVNAAIGASNFCVIVTEPLVEALEQVGSTVRIVKALTKPAGIVLNKCPPRSSALNLARTALAAFEIPVCPQQITSLIVHSYSAASGLVASETDPGSRAATEIATVWRWVKREAAIS
jgi:chromosome partitioning protein